MRVFFSSVVLLLGGFSCAAAVNNSHAFSLPKFVLRTGVYARGSAEISVQNAEFPGYQRIQALAVNEKGELQRFAIYRNCYTGEFYHQLDQHVIRNEMPTRFGLPRPDLNQHYVAESLKRFGSLHGIVLTHGELSNERHYVDIVLDDETATVNSIQFIVQQAVKKFLGIPYRYRVVSEGEIYDCEEQLTL